MFALRAISICTGVLLSLLAASSAWPLQSRIEDRTGKSEAPPKKAPKVPKRTVWNLDGGVFFATDGHLENGSCFRLTGQVTAPEFFDGLRRIDTDDGTTYVLRNQAVTQFPDELNITMRLRDAPCSLDLKDSAVRPPITAEVISMLRLNFYWKSGVAMRPVESSRRTDASIRRLTPYSAQAAEELAPRFEWNYSFVIQSAGVPLNNDLVFIIENEDHKIAARTAARL